MKPLILTVTVAALLAATACTATTTANDSPAGPVPTVAAATPSAPPMHEVGETVEVRDQEGNTARVTVVSAKYSTAPNTSGRAASNGGWLTLDVLWETTAGLTSPSVMQWNTDAADGSRPTLELSSTFGTGPVPQGEKRRGTIVDDIGKGPWTVTYGAQLGTPVFWKIQP
jgi:hypothetical protein